MKRVRSQLSVSKSIVEGVSSGASLPFCGHCKKRHLGECWKKLGACLRSESMEIGLGSVLVDIETGMIVGCCYVVCYL